MSLPPDRRSCRISARSRTMRSDSSNQREAVKFRSAYADVDDHHIRVVAIIESIARQKVAGLDHSSNPRVLKDARRHPSRTIG
jgi:hypothetical protein